MQGSPYRIGRRSRLAAYASWGDGLCVQRVSGVWRVWRGALTVRSIVDGRSPAEWNGMELRGAWSVEEEGQSQGEGDG